MTTTYSTTNVVLLGGFIYVEDFSRDTGIIDVPERVAAAIDAKHVRKFGPFEGRSAMHWFTMWLQVADAVVDKCWVLGPELTDEERAT